MKSKGWVAGITWQAFRRPNADRTQGIGLGVLICVLGALCVRAPEESANCLIGYVIAFL